MIPLARITFVAATTVAFAGPVLAQSDFQACLQTIQAEATRQGVPAPIADRAFQGLTPDQKVVDLDSRQPEFSLTYAKYVGASVTAERVVGPAPWATCSSCPRPS